MQVFERVADEGGFAAAGCARSCRILTKPIVESDAILVASPAYVKRKGLPSTPEELAQHACLRLRRPDGPLRAWRLWSGQEPEQVIEINIDPILVAHTRELNDRALGIAADLSKRGKTL